MTEHTAQVNSHAKKDLEGGREPALEVQAVATNDQELMPEVEGVSPVSDLRSLRRFVRKMAGQHLTCAVSYDDTLSMIGTVVSHRRLNDIFDPVEVSAIIREELDDVVDPSPNSEPAAKARKFQGLITAEQLQTADFPPPIFVVPGLIAEGITLLAGKPKLGKSWLMLDIALGVASGQSVLGNMPAAQGQVLGLFLEDSERRLQSRIAKLAPVGAWPPDLVLSTQWSRIDEGGLADIDAWCRQANNPKCIIIDTLAKLRPATVGRKSQYDLDYDSLAGLHRLAHEFQVAILVVHHTRKADADDVFDTVSGTLGLTGAADSILILSRRSGKAVLHARGRDIEDSENALKFDPAGCRWVCLGDASDVLVSDQRARILAALDSASEPLSPKELMLATGTKNRNSIDILLSKMVQENQIHRAGRGKYVGHGKIGKKDSAADQPSEAAKESATMPNLSDLSTDKGPGGIADGKTTP